MKLYIIGNGFDLSHNLPTAFDKDFKTIVEKDYNDKMFWDLYQTDKPDIWADFEYCLGKPDFESLEEILNVYKPDFNSEHESDRTQIILQADICGNLQDSLKVFAENAEHTLNSTSPLKKYLIFGKNDLFINFNYIFKIIITFIHYFNKF